MAETARETDVSREQTNSSVSKEGLWIALLRACSLLDLEWRFRAGCSFVRDVVAATMNPGSAFIHVDVDNAARLDAPEEDKSSLLHFAFNQVLLAVALQVLFPLVQLPCQTLNVELVCVAITARHKSHMA